jgi:predicted PurR-regulated permease PerM
MVFIELTNYIPGILGAITLYILSREKYFQLVYKRKYGKLWVAMTFVIGYLIILGLPFLLAGSLISPKINELINDPGAFIASVKSTLMVVQQKLGFSITLEKTINSSVEKFTSIIPSIFNSTANLISNLVIMLFLLYYMLYSGSNMEKTLFKIIPLKERNKMLLAAESKTTIKSNAIGIPLISIIQGITAGIGYLIFGVNDVVLWGFLTGIFSFLPVLGTMIVWVPICIYMYASGNAGMAIGLALYSAIVTANIDYFARISIMKKLGDVHPVITLFGIIIGLNLFGFIGLIFGPLLLNYIIVLFKIYMNEFVDDQASINELNSAKE